MNNIELMYSKRQKELVKDSVINRISKIIDSGTFIHGQDVLEFENIASKYCGAKHAIGCANGTDALTIALMAIGLEKDDVVFTPAFTFVATAESIAILGGKPYFVDVDPVTYNIDTSSLRSSIEDARSRGLKIKAVITVDLFGQACNYSEISKIAKEYGIAFISDAAQAFGASYNAAKVGNIADITTTSFFPTKPLGCYGDGGMIFTNDDELNTVMRSICFHGKGSHKYYNVRIGMNSRLDSIQAAVLIEKIKHFDAELEKRRGLAEFYNSHLEGAGLTLPYIGENNSAWAVYTLQHPKRDEIIKALNEAGVPSNIYYPIPLNMQDAYKDSHKLNDLAVSKDIASKVFCLPMHAYVDEEQRLYIVETLKSIIKRV